MFKILCLASCMIPFMLAGQTTHSVSVLINQGTECPNPLNAEVQKRLFEFYPNPAEETITIQSEIEHFEVRIYSLQGELVHRSYQVRKEGKLDVQNLAEGIYLLEVHTDYHSESRKIKIQR